jgi:MFS family permease
MANMGIWSVFTFLLFYLQKVVGMDRAAAAQTLPALLGAGAALAIPASLIGARLADRHGIVRLVGVTSWIMAAAALCYALIALHPDLVLVVPVLLVFAAANGAYGAVDWAMALKVLPALQDAGKDMGFWHICMVLPQILGPAGIGWLITWIENAASARVAYAVAFAIAALWFTLAAILVAVPMLSLRVKRSNLAGGIEIASSLRSSQ